MAIGHFDCFVFCPCSRLCQYSICGNFHSSLLPSMSRQTFLQPSSVRSIVHHQIIAGGTVQSSYSGPGSDYKADCPVFILLWLTRISPSKVTGQSSAFTSNLTMSVKLHSSLSILVRRGFSPGCGQGEEFCMVVWVVSSVSGIHCSPSLFFSSSTVIFLSSLINACFVLFPCMCINLCTDG